MSDQWITSPNPEADREIVVAQLEQAMAERDQEPITFMAYVKDFMWNARDGELTIKLAAPIDQKYLAMRITDHPGMMFDITAKLVVFEDEDEDDA